MNDYTTTVLANKIKKYSDFIIDNLNSKAIKNNEPIRYGYEEYVGITKIEDRSANKYISIKLNVTNEKTKHILNLILNNIVKQTKIRYIHYLKKYLVYQSHLQKKNLKYMKLKGI